MFKKIACLFLLLLPTTVFAAQETEPQPISIVASFSLLGDMVQQIGGDKVDVHTLVGPKEDAHTFQPSPQDALFLTDAEIIAVNGLRYEGWMTRLIKASGTKAKLLVASFGVQPRLMEEEGHEGGEAVVDPHAWQNLKNGQLYAKNIAAALIEARPAWTEEFKARARAYIAQMKTLDEKARTSFAALPETGRKLIITHDALGYFADAYGLAVVAPVGISTEAQPTPQDIAALIDQIKAEKIRALFLENTTDARLMEQIARDTGTRIGGTLYTDALDDNAPTYLKMMEANIETVSRALK